MVSPSWVGGNRVGERGWKGVFVGVDCSVVSCVGEGAAHAVKVKTVNRTNEDSRVIFVLFIGSVIGLSIPSNISILFQNIGFYLLGQW
jgi:hypothetical protein